MLIALEIILALVAVAYLLLGVVVLVKNPRQKLNQTFFFLLVSLVGWVWANTLSNLTNIPDRQILIYNYATFLFPALSVYFVLKFILILSGNYKKLSPVIRIVMIAATALAAVLGASPHVIAGIQKSASGNIIIFGPLVSYYFLDIIGFGLAIIALLVVGLRNKRGLEKSRLQLVSLGIFLTLVVSVATNLLVPIFADNFALSTLGPVSTIGMVAGFAYAIIRQKLFDIRLVVARSVMYILLLISLAAVYALAMFGLTQLFFKSSSVSPQQNAASVVMAIFLAFSFQPLRRFFEQLTNKLFFRHHYDSQVVLDNISNILVRENVLDRILERTLKEICESLYIEFGQLIVFNNDRVYRIGHYGTLPKRLMVAPELAELNHPMLVVDSLPEGKHKKLMDDHNIRVSVTLRTHEEFVGYLLLGEKMSGDIYSDQDIELIQISTKQLAIAIQNAKAYAQIQEFNKTLQARVDHATKRLRVANRHLKELDRAKDEFISMASHQLRTPLTTIKGYLSMLLEGDAGKMTGPQTEFVAYAFGSSERMVNLISDLLNVSRLSAGRFLIQTKPTDMVSMIDDEVRQLMTHATAKNIKLVFDRPAKPLPPAEIDENKTRQVVMNFIDNAIYYTKEGEVRVVLEQSGNCVRLEVRDSGIGVPETAKKKLFSKFFRAENAQTVRPDGTGLGLYLAKRVVEDQGGTIIFNSVEGKGSTFGFEIPFRPVTPIREEAHAK